MHYTKDYTRKLILYASAKINIGLQVLRKREDGFHDISTIMLPIPFYDIIEIRQTDSKSGQLSFSQSGLKVPDKPEKNLCYKAWELFNQHCNTGIVNIHLHKQIPMGAGLGGGSSDAASILFGLNELMSRPFAEEKLLKMAESIGSDCPLFILGRSALAEGKGERLQPLELNLDAYELLLLNPGLSVNTAEAYRMIEPRTAQPSLLAIKDLPPDKWSSIASNDFETPIFSKYPRIRELKNSLYNAGAAYASMSGSGSSVFGIFNRSEKQDSSMFPDLIWRGSFRD